MMMNDDDDNKKWLSKKVKKINENLKLFFVCYSKY